MSLHTYTSTETYTILPDNIEEAVGCMVRLHPNADENTIKVYSRDDYVFLLAEKKDWHKNGNDRIRLIPNKSS